MRRSFFKFNLMHFTDFPYTRLVVINREKALNSMNLTMIKAMRQAYFVEPHPKKDAAIWVVKGAGGNSFCAGGDVISVAKNPSIAPEFFYNEYQTNYHILTMPNIQVSLWNGYVMGGGVGVSVHGRYRIASEKTVFAMPETAIGLFPDVGASWFLPRLKMKGLGLYLGLTGARLKGADVVHAGLATHYVPAAFFDKLEEKLCHIDDSAKVKLYLDEFSVKELPPFTLEPHRSSIERVFELADATTVGGIFDLLSSDGSDFAKDTLDTLKKMSPTSLVISLEMQKIGAKATDPADIFRMDYIGALRCVENPNFYEGVRALLIDKTKDPRWNPATVAEVTQEDVEKYFMPFAADSWQWHPKLAFGERAG